MRRALRRILPLVGLTIASSLGAQGATPAAPPAHPLDGLRASEIWAAHDVLRVSGRIDSTAQFAMVQLREPMKADVLAWEPGRPARREALAVVRQGRRTYEAVVDVGEKRLASWREIPGAQTHFTDEEFERIGGLIKKHPEVRAALARRGYTDLSTVRCGGGPPGYFGTPEQQNGRRVARGQCRDRRGVYNTWGRIIEGLVAWVDMDSLKVLRVVDRGIVPMTTAPTDFDDESVGAARAALPPLDVQMPMGAGFKVEGGQVSWANWRFHLRVDPRVGLVVGTAKVQDGDRWRSVLYQGHLSEIFVPYMDSTTGWYDRVFLDAGEYAFEGLTEPLEPGVDCPSNAAYLDANVATANGFPRRRARLVCLFERTGGAVAWRHGTDGGDDIVGRPTRELVVRSAATVGNYDYIFDWTFRQDGAIRVGVGATGILEVRNVGPRRLASRDASAGGALAAPDDEQFGRLLAEGILGVNHDHFFSFRLDLDIDGPANSLAAGKLVMQRLPEPHPRRSLWTMQERVLATEKDAQLDMNMHAPELWRVVSASARGPLGRPTSYEIQPGHNATLLLSPDDWPARRAGFSRHQLWVTPYARDERYAAGDYPTLSSSEPGLPAWTKANRAIAGTDVVAWYTMGFHHVPRAEDWPVMPTAWHEFTIRPFDFFARNPVLDLPRKP